MVYLVLVYGATRLRKGSQLRIKLAGWLIRQRATCPKRTRNLAVVSNLILAEAWF